MIWSAGVRFPAEASDFFLPHSVQTTLGPTQPPIQWVPLTSPPGVKQQRRKTDHSPPFSVEVKNGGAIPPLPHMSSWHGA
jgi:hypothetical protein